MYVYVRDINREKYPYVIILLIKNFKCRSTLKHLYRLEIIKLADKVSDIFICKYICMFTYTCGFLFIIFSKQQRFKILISINNATINEKELYCPLFGKLYLYS